MIIAKATYLLLVTVASAATAEYEIDYIASTSHVTVADSLPIFYRSWAPRVGEPKAVVYIAHGMAEHSERYSRFAIDLVRGLGVKVVAPDHRAHGLTACPSGLSNLVDLGVLHRGDASAREDPISLMAFDLLAVIQDSNGGNALPVFLFGHSMGSVIARVALVKADPAIRGSIKGVILSGVPTAPSRVEYYPLAGLGSLIKWSGVGLEFIQKTVINGKFDNLVRSRVGNPKLGGNCFISSNPEAVTAYNEHPLSGHLVDPEILVSIGTNLMKIHFDPTAFYAPLEDTKVYMLYVSGRDDPVCMFGATAQTDAQNTQRLGHPSHEVYIAGARHEFLNEVEPIREFGVSQVMAWIKSRIF